MAVVYVENDTAQACALNNFCSTVGGTIEAGRQAEAGVAAGATEVTFTCATSQADDNEFSFECIVQSGTSGDAGNWIIRVNFTTGSMDVTWESVFICRVSSACVNQETIGSSTGLGIATNAGVQSTTVSGSAVTISAGDKVIITLGFSNANTMFVRTVGITPDQNIDSPFTPPSVVQPLVPFLAVRDFGDADKPIDARPAFFALVPPPPPPPLPANLVVPFFKGQWLGDTVEPIEMEPRFFPKHPILKPAPPPAPKPVIPMIEMPVVHWNDPIMASYPWDPSERPHYQRLVTYPIVFTDYETFLQFDVPQYTSPTVFLEAVMRSGGTGKAYARLFNITDSLEEARINTSNTTNTRVRSGALSLSGTKEYKVQAGIPPGGTTTILGARLVVQQ